MSQLNVSIPPALKSWIESRVAEGRYSSASDYVRDLDSAADETVWLRGLIEEGLASGLSIRTQAKFSATSWQSIQRPRG